MRMEQAVEDFGLYLDSFLYSACTADGDTPGALRLTAVSLANEMEIAAEDFRQGGVPYDTIIKTTAETLVKHGGELLIFVGCGEGILI